MRILLPALLALAAIPLPAQAQTAAPPAPPILVSPQAVPAATLVHYDAASVRCGTDEQSARLAVTPFETVSWRNAEAPRKPVIFGFRIDAQGRPLGIARVGDPNDYLPDTEDLAPALAASRFPAGPPRVGCIATYTPNAAPIDAAPKAQLYRYFGMPHRTGAFDRQIFNAIRPAGANCFPSAPQPRTLNFPDYEAISQLPGTASFVVLRYDLDADGRPANLQVLASEGNAALDRAASEAVASSRFEPGVRTGCLTRFYRRQANPAEAPPAPDTAGFKPAGALCPDRAQWAEMPRLVFPDNYLRRAIEGWAIIGYDVAPWGETGKLRVLASEPSADFGKAALPIVTRARQPASGRGLTGCVVKVRFAVPPRGAPPRAEDAADDGATY